MEIPPVGIYLIDMDKPKHLKLFPWKRPSEDILLLLKDFKKNFQFESIEMCDTIINPSWLWNINLEV